MGLRINNIGIKNPSGFKMELYNVTTMERLANGTMVGDLVAKKHKFYITYDCITQSDLDDILSAIWDTAALFFPFTYPYKDATSTVIVYTGSIPADLYSAKSPNWVWRNVSFNLIER